MAAIGYYIFILPLSYLPLGVLYLFTDLFYLLMITLFPYRDKVITDNIRRSFPDKSEAEIKRIRRRFYGHFTDILAEGVKNLTISEKALRKRMVVKNPELMGDLYKQNRSVLLVSGHYNNWEWLISVQNKLFPHQAYGIGMPMTSKFWDKKVNERRSRFGMRVIHAKNYKQELANCKEAHSVLVLADQSPGDSKKSYWTQFLNQQTAVLFGTELIANEMGHAVVFFSTRKVKRGHYEIELKLLSDQPELLHWGELTELHVRELENLILEKPEHWLWSHKRWKRELPANLDELKNEQEKKFNSKYRS